MKRLLLLAPLLLLLSASLLFAQEEKEKILQFGVLAAGGINTHTANFQTLPGVPSCCPRYESGSGFGFDAGLFYDFPSSTWYSVEARVAFSSLSATLTKQEYTTVTVNDLDAQGIFEHTVATTINLISFSPVVKCSIVGQLSFMIGPKIGYVLSNSYSEKEELIEPQNNGTFKGGSRIRNQFSGATADASPLYIGAIAGLQYKLPLNTEGTAKLIPEINYTYGITGLANGLEWKANSFRAGAAIEFQIFKDIPPPPPPPPPVVIEPPPIVVKEIKKEPLLSASLDALAVETDGSTAPIRELVVEDYIRTQYRPLLNYIFFNQGSSELPSRYKLYPRGGSGMFNVNKLNEAETLPMYYDVLNIIGERLIKYPKAKITITGCTDEIGTEKNNKELAAERAGEVGKYFADVWNIDPSRIKLQSRGLPEQPSSVSDSDGAEENRRVEIQSNYWQVMEPLLTIDTAHIPKPPTIRFIPKVESELALSHWQFKAFDDRRGFRDTSGSNQPPVSVEFQVVKESAAILASLQPIHSTLAVTNIEGTSAPIVKKEIPVRHYTLEDKHREGSIDTIVSRYSLILFNFDRSELSEANRRIADFVKERISKEATVNILGYTDRIGSAEYNRQLSEQRAQATQKYLGLSSASVEGIGQRTLLYDNTLPEGRFYSRTVTVVVSTPLKR